MAGKVAVLVLYAVLARELGAAPVGYLTLALSMSILVQIGALGTDPLLTGEIAREPQSLRRLFWNCLLIKAVIGGAVALVIVVVAVVGDFSPPVRVALLIMLASGMIDLMASTSAAVLRGKEAMVPVAYSGFVQRMVTTAIGVVSVTAANAGIVAVSLGYVAGSVVGAALLVTAVERRGLRPQANVSLKKARAIAVDSWPLGIGTALGAVLARADAILLSALATASVVGLYGAAYRVMESTFFVSWAVGMAVYPVLSRLGPATNPTIGRAFALASRVAYAGLLPLGAVLALFSDSIVDALFGPGFAAAAAPLRWLGVVAAFYGLGAMSTYALVAQGLRRTVAAVALAVVAVNLTLNLLLIPRFGASGAAVAMACAQIGFTAISTWLAGSAVGGISVTRLTLLPSASLLAMGAVRLILGGGLLVIPVSVAAYAAVLVISHSRLFPDDTRMLTAWFTRLGGRTPGAGARV